MKPAVLVGSLAACFVLVSATPGSAQAGRERSEASALLLSAGPTAAGAGLLVAGLVTDEDILELAGLSVLTIGPSFGHYHTGDVGRGLVATGVRVVGLGIIVVSALSDDLCFEDCDDDNDSKVGMIGGALLFVGATAFDILDAPASARRNRRPVSITPTVMPSSSGPVGGMAVVGAF